MHQLTATVQRQSRLSWLRALPLLARPVCRTMPWGTLLASCLAGTLYLAIVAHVGKDSGWLLGQGNVRLAFLPAVAGMAFVLRVAFRPLTEAVPVPSWVTPAGHLLLAVPILAATCWGQLCIMTQTIPPHALGHPPAIYPLLAQLTGWCAVATVAAACVARSRYADLGGAIGAPVSFAAITLAWFAPITSRILVEPAATAKSVTIAWYAIAAAALLLTCAAMRDQWHRYSRRRFRLRLALAVAGLVAEGEDRRLDAVLQAEFGEQAADVRFDCLLADRQVPGDLPVAEAAGDEPEYVAFAR